MKAGWEVRRIGEVCDLLTGGTPSKAKPEYFGGSIKWLVSGDVHQGEILDCEGRITEAGLQNSNARYLPVDSVLIALAGQGKTRGTVALLRTKATCNQSLICISPKDRQRLLPEFIYVNLHGRYEEIRRMTGDSGDERRGLNMRLVSRIEIPIPPIPEQRRIVALLDEAFEGIAAAKVNAEKNLRSAKEVFASQRECLLSGVEQDWGQKPLGELCEIKHGFAFKSKYFTDDGDFVCLTPGNFFEDGGYRDRGDKTKYYSGPIPEGFVLSAGQMLVAMTEQAPGLLGSPAIVPAGQRFLHNQRLGLICPKANTPWVNDFFFHVFNRPLFRKAVHHTATGVKVRHTSPSKLGQIRVSFPASERDQRRVAAAISAIQQEVDSHQDISHQKTTALDELKASLLRQAFAGNL